MPYPQFQNINCQIWQHRQRLGISPDAFCIHHETVSKGRQLLQVIRELQACEAPAQRLLTFVPTRQKIGFTRLRLELCEPSDDLRVMCISRESQLISIQSTAIGLALLNEAVASWLDGAEDFGISPLHASMPRKEFGQLDKNSAEIWFWGQTMMP